MTPIDKQDFGYLLGREVAIIEKMFNYGPEFNFFGKVAINPKQKLHYHSLKALNNEKHNLHPELLEVISARYNSNKNLDLPSFLKPTVRVSFALGYYHELKHILDNYPVLGIVEEKKIEYVPQEVEVKENNIITELQKQYGTHQ